MKKVIAVILVTIFMGVSTCPMSARAASADDVLALMNAERAKAGLSELVMNDDLVAVAQTRAIECSTKFSHTRPNGKAWYTVSSLTNGENLAHAVNNNQQKPENVVLAWMLSPTHKANVLRATASSVGIYYYYAENGETYIVCEFN